MGIIFRSSYDYFRACLKYSSCKDGIIFDSLNYLFRSGMTLNSYFVRIVTKDENKNHMQQ
jgi:hypothetical protein